MNLPLNSILLQDPRLQLPICQSKVEIYVESYEKIQPQHQQCEQISTIIKKYSKIFSDKTNGSQQQKKANDQIEGQQVQILVSQSGIKNSQNLREILKDQSNIKQSELSTKQQKSEISNHLSVSSNSQVSVQINMQPNSTLINPYAKCSSFCSNEFAYIDNNIDKKVIYSALKKLIEACKGLSGCHWESKKILKNISVSVLLFYKFSQQINDSYFVSKIKQFQNRQNKYNNLTKNSYNFKQLSDQIKAVLKKNALIRLFPVIYAQSKQVLKYVLRQLENVSQSGNKKLLFPHQTSSHKFLFEYLTGVLICAYFDTLLLNLNYSSDKQEKNTTNKRVQYEKLMEDCSQFNAQSLKKLLKAYRALSQTQQ